MKIYSLIFLFVLLLDFSCLHTYAQWFEQNSGTDYNLRRVFFVNENVGYVTGHRRFVGQQKLMLKTTNGGINWTIINFPSYSNIIPYSLWFVNEDTGYATGSGSDPSYSLYKTADGGFNWENITFTGFQTFSVEFTDENTGYVGAYGVIYKTTDAGMNWVVVEDYPGLDFITFCFLNKDTGFASNFGPGGSNYVWRTTDAGLNWVPRPTGYLLISRFSMINFDTGYAIGGFIDGSGSLFITTRGGDSWNYIQNLPCNANDVHAFSYDTLYVVGCSRDTIANVWFSVIYRTTDGCITWERQYQSYTEDLCYYIGGNNYTARMFFVNRNVGYVVGENGVILKTTNGGEPVGIKPISNKIPDKFQLYQNYPNPFNPSTKIKFSIPLLRGVSEGRGVSVKLKIYDILGREVTTLVSEKQNAGTYEVEFDGSNYPSGVYFYRIQAGSFTAVKKMLMIK